MFGKEVFLILLLCAIAFCISNGGANAITSAKLRIASTPLHSGRISPMLYGAFIELLDDLVPGMRSELLNDRCFDGVLRASDYYYYRGEPNFCDRTWDENETWTRDNENPFNSEKCARLTASKNAPASLTQSNLATKKDMTYHFSGSFRTEASELEIEVILRTLLPDGNWMVLASKKLPPATSSWTKLTCDLPSSGTTDKAVFEIKVTGDGDLWVDEVSLMPSDNIKGWRPDVVEAMKDVNPGQIRWGGCFVDPGAYQWKNGIGDKDRRTGFVQRPWGRLDPMDVGIDEFLQFCELTDTTPLICISFGDSVENALDLMEYCNGGINTTWGKRRAENGHPEPYNVKYWQMGNELGGPEYAEQCLKYAKAMKESDPSAAILSSYPGEEVAKLAGKYIDYMCPHHYTSNLEYCEKSFNGITKLAEKHIPGRSVKIGVTEWNTTGGDWGIGRGKLMTLYCALQNAQYMNLMHRHSDVVGLANRSNIVNCYGSGMIQTKLDGLYKHPSYYVMKLYADHSKTIPVKVDGSQEGLDLSACRSEDGKSLCIFTVNTTQDPFRINLDLTDYTEFVPGDSEAVCDTLDAHQPELMNCWQAPDRVRIVKMNVTGSVVTIPAYSAAAVEFKKP